MFISLIATLIAILVIVTYMATSGIVTNANEVKITYEKIKFVYSIEKVLVNATENLCQKDYLACKNKENSGVITLTLNDLVGYMPDNFTNSNLNGGIFGNIQILNNYSTIRINQDVPGNTARNIYLKHYIGKEYGIAPNCVSGSINTTIPCDNTYVYHDYPSTLSLRNALSN